MAGKVQSGTYEAVWLALDALRRHKLRSFLTILGIVIGVMVVIAITAVINGLSANVMAQIEDIGSNLIFVYKFNFATIGRPPSDWFTRKELTYEDYLAVAQLPYVEAAATGIRIFMPQFGEGTYSVRYGGNRAKNAIVEGDTPSGDKVFALRMKTGRWFTETDDQHRLMVCILGYDTADTLFPMMDPLGKEVEVEGQWLTVVGVLEKQKRTIGGGKNPEDNIVFLPLETFRKLHPEQKDFVISVKAESPEMMPVVIDEIRELLRRRRHVPFDKPDNFAVFTQDAFTDLWRQLTGGIFIVGFAVGSVGLIVGGVGVMNIMLVSVTERTREIGIRKAIGARQRDILWQFILEAITLTAVGGVIGIAVGSLVALILRISFSFLPTTVSPGAVAVGFLVSSLIGLIFGIYPAWKAARLNPVEALRYE
jgi:putative ABC transport system permease protein